MNIKFQSIFNRFLKGAIASAITSMGVVSISQPSVWGEFSTILSSLAIAGVYGGITGLLLALQKWASWQD